MTTTPPEPTTPPTEEQVEEQLNALEAAAIAAAIAFLAAAQLPPVPFPIPGRPGVEQALAAEHYRTIDPTPLVEQLHSTLLDTAVLAANASGTPTDPQTLRRTIADLLDTVHAEILSLLQDTARALGGDLTIDTTPPSEHLARLHRDLARTIVTWMYTAYNTVVDWVARTTGNTTQWVTENDPRVCPICAPLNGTTPGPGGIYPAATTWRGYQGRPPAHPWCRCRLKIARRR